MSESILAYIFISPGICGQLNNKHNMSVPPLSKKGNWQTDLVNDRLTGRLKWSTFTETVVETSPEILTI